MSSELHRRACINDVERLHDVLPLAVRISGNTTDVFKIDLPTRHGCRTLLWLMQTLFTPLDAIIGLQDAVNGLAGRDRQLEEAQHWTALQIVMNGILTRNPPQPFRRLISNGKDLGYDRRMRLLRRVLAGSAVTLQDLFQWLAFTQFLLQAFEPFLHPLFGVPHCCCKLGVAPFWMVLPQVIQIGSGCVV